MTARPTSTENVAEARWRHAAQVLASSGDPIAADCAYRLAIWLDRGTDFETAAGFPSGWRCERERARRHELVRTLAREHFANLAGRELATSVYLAAIRYEGSAWLRDRKSGRRPPGMSGAIFDVLAAGKFPSFTSLRRILNGLTGPRGGYGVGPADAGS